MDTEETKLLELIQQESDIELTTLLQAILAALKRKDTILDISKLKEEGKENILMKIIEEGCSEELLLTNLYIYNVWLEAAQAKIDIPELTTEQKWAFLEETKQLEKLSKHLEK